MRVEFVVRGEPVTQGSKRAFLPRGTARPVVVDANPASLKSWRSDVKAAAIAAYSEQPVEGPVAVRLEFYFARPKSHSKKRQEDPRHSNRPDLAKLARAVEDACTGVLWKDDSQIYYETLIKRYAWADHMPGVAVTVWDNSEVTS